MKHKVTGYLLVCVGLLVILFAAVSMYKVFVGHQPVVAVVQLADMNLKTQMGVMVFPMGNFNPLINLGLFALFMLFMVTVGGQIAKVGCHFLKIERLHEALTKKEEPLSKEQAKKL